MTTPIQPPEGPGITGPITVVRATSSQAPSATENTGAAEEPVWLETMPSSPPADVLAEMRHASEQYDQLGSAGLEVRFNGGGGGEGRAAASLHDGEGNFVRALKASEVLELAAGQHSISSGR